MSATSQILLVYVNGVRKALNSNATSLLFQGLGITNNGSDNGYTITQVGSTFDFNAKALANIGGITLASGTITGLAAPSALSDAATKTYVDTADGLLVPKTGASMTGNLTFDSVHTVTGLPTPTNATDAVTKAYADAVMVAARIQENVRVATTGNINLSSAPATIDDVTMVSGDRVLVQNQTTTSQNGIYIYNGSGSAMTRDASLNNTPTSDIYNGVLVPYVEAGTVNTGKAFVISSIGSGTGGVHTIGTDAITWTQFATPASYTGGPGIWFNGTAITANPDGVTLDASGATANGSATLEVKALGIGTAQLAAGAVTAAKLGAVTDGLTLDQSGSGSTLEVKALGIGTAQLAAQAVTAAKLGAVTGAGLTGGGGSVIALNYDGVTLDVSGTGSSLEVKALGIGSGQLGNGSVVQGKVAASVAGVGITVTGSGSTTQIAANPDGVTLDTSGAGSTLEIKTGGVSSTQLANGSVVQGKVAASAAGAGLTVTGSGATTQIAANPDGVTLNNSGAGSTLQAIYYSSLINDNAGTITVGQTVYLKSNGHVDLAGNTTSNLDQGELGIVQDATILTTIAGNITVRPGAIVGGYSGLTPGAQVYVGATAGSITQTVPAYASGTCVYSIGRALSATQIIYDPMHILTYV
jgi:hypothetical protein